MGMEARLFRAAVLAAACLSSGAGYRTTNFAVQAPSAEQARLIAEAAERYRKELAVEWLGEEMPPWSSPCPITAKVASGLGAGGATSFLFDRGEVYGWRMTIQGSLERILDSVLPHEITHTIFACHFRQALPRWADEGACTTVEHPTERAKQERMLIQFLQTGRGLSFSQMFQMREYPADVMPLYAQGHSLARYLLCQGGKKKYLDFLADGLEDGNWPGAIHKHYGHASLLALQNGWLEWVRRGSPEFTRPAGAQPGDVLVATAPPRTSGGDMIYRGQSADPPESPSESADLVPVPPRPARLSHPIARSAAVDPRRGSSEGSHEVIFQWSRPESDASETPPGAVAEPRFSVEWPATTLR
jgi:hypothetical protein